MTQLIERPQFFEGQFIGAADLDAIVQFARDQQSRHDLGWHTWGIAQGLELREQPGAGGSIDLFLLPGVAVDGFGRAITVSAPYALTPDLFKAFTFDAIADTGNPPGRLIEVWLRYDETPTQPPRKGFQTCDPGTPFARVAEGFRIEVGARPTLAERQERIIAGDYLLFAEESVQTFNPQTPAVVLADQSVGYQEFPAPGQRRRWLIPLGAVRWLPNTNPAQAGSFVARAAADAAYSQSLRRPVGVVAGALQAAERAIRLRDRLRPYSTVDSADLVWVEGSLRTEGDLRLFGGALAFLLASGSDGGVPLDLRRASSATGEVMLQAAIGAGNAGKNRFGVGPLIAAGSGPKVVDEKLSVLDNGNVGIGTTAPRLKLHIKGDLGDPDGPATLNLFGSRIGDVGGGVLFVRSGGGVVAFDGGDNVGIGSAAPNRPLAVRSSGEHEELVSFEDSTGAVKWHINQKINNNPGLNFVETNVADGRLFLQAGGNVGIGTAAPALKLEIQGDFGRPNGPCTASLFGSRIGDIGDGVLFLRSGGSVVAFDGADNVGVGTATPSARFEVAGGDIALRPGLFAPARVLFKDLVGATRGSISMGAAGTTGLNLIGGSGGTPHLSVNDNGFVIIGDPAAVPPFGLFSPLLYVDGDAAKPGGGSWSAFSDVRLKKEITPLDDALDRLLALRGVSFEWNDPARMGGLTGRQIGFLAHEVEQVFPEWVKSGAAGMQMVTVRGFEALAVEAMRALKQENDALRTQVETLAARLTALEQAVNAQTAQGRQPPAQEQPKPAPRKRGAGEPG